MENKSDKFKRIATKRTRNIIENIRVLGNTSNKISYSYTEDEVDKIFSAIRIELKKQEDKFRDDKREIFTLS